MTLKCLKSRRQVRPLRALTWSSLALVRPLSDLIRPSRGLSGPSWALVALFEDLNKAFVGLEMDSPDQAGLITSMLETQKQV